MLDAPLHDLTVCALPMSMNMLATLSTLENLNKAVLSGELGCATAGPDHTFVVVPLPAIRRSDAPE
ncbi:MAG: hypothetical protein AB7P03_26220 [Kofleriaceae bacterium]